MIRDHLESNRTTAGLLRDSEALAAKLAEPLLDLRTVPRDGWDALLDRELLVPPGVAAYLAGQLTDAPPFPLPAAEADAIAQTVEKFHGIAAPYYVEMSTRLQQTGRAWAYVPEAAPYVSGFYFSKE